MKSFSNHTSCSVIFDLDGTLIDSQPGIFESLKFALSAAGFNHNLDVSEVPIGPPLLQLIQSITGSTDRSITDPIVYHFKSHYDSSGYASSRLFDGVYDFLSGLHAAHYDLFIATNKRFVPTLKILRAFAIDPFFKGVYAVDSSGCIFDSKASMLKSLILDYSIVSNVLYLGDRYDDYEAARLNSIPFRIPLWGYSNERFMFPSDIQGINLCSASEIKSIVLS